jgi:hypothetical protein
MKRGIFMGKSFRLALLFAVALCTVILSGCGDGGGGGGTAPSKAVIVFSTGLPAGSAEQIGSVDISFELPTGVTLPTSAGAIPTGSSGILKFSGEGARFAALPNANAAIIGNYTPATSTSKATVSVSAITLTNAGQGMNPGEVATLVCDLAPGVTIDLAAFRPTSLLIGNASGVKLYDILAGITGPASASYTVTLLNENPGNITGATGGSSISGSF